MKVFGFTIGQEKYRYDLRTEDGRKNIAEDAYHFANKAEKAVGHMLKYALLEGVFGFRNSQTDESAQDYRYHRDDRLRSLAENVVSRAACVTAVTLYSASFAHKKIGEQVDKRVTPKTYKSIFAKEGARLVFDTALTCAAGAVVGAPLVPIATTCVVIRGYCAGKHALGHFTGAKEKQG